MHFNVSYVYQKSNLFTICVVFQVITLSSSHHKSPETFQIEYTNYGREVTQLMHGNYILISIKIFFIQIVLTTFESAFNRINAARISLMGDQLKPLTCDFLFTHE